MRLWPAFRARPTADRPARARFGGAGRGRRRGRGVRSARCGRHHCRGVHPSTALAQAAACVSAARAGRHSRADQLQLLRIRPAVEAGRGRDRDAGGDPAAVEGRADRSRTVRLPRMRGDSPSLKPLDRVVVPPHRLTKCRAWIPLTQKRIFMAETFHQLEAQAPDRNVRSRVLGQWLFRNRSAVARILGDRAGS